jgi:hypothetical protein
MAFSISVFRFVKRTEKFICSTAPEEKKPQVSMQTNEGILVPPFFSCKLRIFLIKQVSIWRISVPHSLTSQFNYNWGKKINAATHRINLDSDMHQNFDGAIILQSTVLASRLLHYRPDVRADCAIPTFLFFN